MQMAASLTCQMWRSRWPELSRIASLSRVSSCEQVRWRSKKAKDNNAGPKLEPPTLPPTPPPPPPPAPQLSQQAQLFNSKLAKSVAESSTSDVSTSPGSRSSSPSSASTSSESQLSSEKPQVCVLIDGDCLGPGHWPSILREIRKYRKVKEVKIFAAPGVTGAKLWQDTVKSVGGEFVCVPRYTVGSKDPNDIAIGAHAAIAGRKNLAVALAVHDADFASLAHILVKEGMEVVAVMPSTAIGVQGAFKKVQVNVLQYIPPGTVGASEGARWKWVMQGDGSCTKELLNDPDKDDVQDSDTLIQRFLEAGYMEAASDPLVPAIVKTFMAHSEGPLVAWPSGLAMRDAHRLLARTPRLKQYNGEYIVVFPVRQGSSTKAQLKEYGTSSCAMFIRGGPPFVLKDGPTEKVIHEFLTRLGYFNPECDRDLDEAVATFANVGSNKRNLELLGFGHLAKLAPHTARATLHAALASPKSHGTWKLAPEDEPVRLFLTARKLIRSKTAEVSIVHEALGHFLERNLKVQVPQNYRSRLLLFREIQNQNDPGRRRPLEE